MPILCNEYSTHRWVFMVTFIVVVSICAEGEIDFVPRVFKKNSAKTFSQKNNEIQLRQRTHGQCPWGREKVFFSASSTFSLYFFYFCRIDIGSFLARFFTLSKINFRLKWMRCATFSYGVPISSSFNANILLLVFQLNSDFQLAI